MVLQTSVDQESIFRCRGSYNILMKDYKDKWLFFGIMCTIRSGMRSKEVNLAHFDFMLTLALVSVLFATFTRRYKKQIPNSPALFKIQQIGKDRFNGRSWALTWKPHRGRIRRSSSFSGSRHRTWRICGETEWQLSITQLQDPPSS